MVGNFEDTINGYCVTWGCSQKVRNKETKAYNGNGTKSLKITHWNMGSCHWINKIVEIQILTDEICPDIALISEANIFSENFDFELNIPGYYLIQPKSISSLGYSRVAVLVKQGIHVKVLSHLMDNEIASVWLQISCKGTKKLYLGAIYRQFKLLNQVLPNMAGELDKQETRWRKFVSQWKKAATEAECVIMGDINIDYNKWDSPSQDSIVMTDLVKTEIETLGFLQYVTKNTRSWPGQEDSLLDQCWSAHPHRIISCRNLVRASSDHNLIEVILRIKGKPSYAGEILSRNRKDFNIESYQGQNI